jgi:hypothetical protein
VNESKEKTGIRSQYNVFCHNRFLYINYYSIKSHLIYDSGPLGKYRHKLSILPATSIALQAEKYTVNLDSRVAMNFSILRLRVPRNVSLMLASNLNIYL